jgi:hypothetical protein
MLQPVRAGCNLTYCCLIEHVAALFEHVVAGLEHFAASSELCTTCPGAAQARWNGRRKMRGKWAARIRFFFLEQFATLVLHIALCHSITTLW